MCSDNESPMPSHRKCKNITKVFPYNLENMIYIVSKRKKLDSIKKQYSNAIICDVTSTSPNSLVKLSPFYPHMNISIPFSPNYTGASVEGAENRGYPPTQNGDIRSLFWLFSLI